MKNNIYFLIRLILISLLFFLLFPLLAFTQSLAPIPEVGPIHCVANCGNGNTTTSGGNTTPSDGNTTPIIPPTSSCPNDCSDNGFCNSDGSCDCYPSWTGIDCSTSICPNGCSGKGFCNDDGSCDCYEKTWTGIDCSTSICLNNCSGNGR